MKSRERAIEIFRSPIAARADVSGVVETRARPSTGDIVYIRAGRIPAYDPPLLLLLPRSREKSLGATICATMPRLFQLLPRPRANTESHSALKPAAYTAEPPLFALIERHKSSDTGITAQWFSRRPVLAENPAGKRILDTLETALETRDSDGTSSFHDSKVSSKANGTSG